MREELLRRLAEITPEEEAVLRGEPLDWTIYNELGQPNMDPGTLMPGGELFAIRPHTRFVAFPRHGHRYVEMIYQVQGQTVHRIDGLETLTLRAGQLLLLSRKTEHEIEAAGRDDLAVNFILIPAFFDNAAVRIGESNALSVFLKGNLDRRETVSGHLLYDVAGNIQIENLLENLVAGQYAGTPLSIQQLTLEILLRLLSRMTDNLVVSTRKDQERAAVLAVLARLEDHVQVNLTETARELGLEVSTLSRLIRQQTGCTFTELLQTARFSRAAVLLRETDLSVISVAAAVGYENTAFFYRQFAARYGCTPGEYRRMIRGTGNSAKSDTDSENAEIAAPQP